jgi:hydrogenase assembly chaperone HypC/HupF
MCLGIPMQVIDGDGLSAVCEGRGERLRIDMQLVGAQPPGTWVLVFQGAARRVMDPDEAAQTLAAIQALESALRGDTDVAHLFADLVDREPQLPEHLRRPQ